MSPDHPDLLWIMCDELRADVLGCYGGRGLVSDGTPAIDALAERGLLFEHCWVNSPVCVSSRLSQHTGLHPERTGVYHNEGGDPGYPFDRFVDTLPQRLGAAGYATVNLGKEHIPKSLDLWSRHDPRGSGLVELLGALDREEVASLVVTDIGFPQGGRFVPAPGRPYPPTRITDRAIAELLDPPPEPFLLRVSYLQPHTPVVPPEPFASRFDPTRFPDAPEAWPGRSRFERLHAQACAGARLAPEAFQRQQASYQGLVAWIDHEVGRLLDALARSGRADRTIVIFSADHGTSIGDGGAFGKHTFAPHVQRVPLIVAGPGIRPDRRVDACELLDFARTTCSLAGVDAPTQFGGRDLLSSAPAPELVFSTIGYGEHESVAIPARKLGRWPDDRGWPRRSCVRSGPYRLDANVRLEGAVPADADRDLFLADARSDPHEVRNRADDRACAAVRDRLLAALLDHAAGAVETDPELVYLGRQGEPTFDY